MVMLNNSTARSVTLSLNTNILLGVDCEKAEKADYSILNGNKRIGKIPQL